MVTIFPDAESFCEPEPDEHYPQIMEMELTEQLSVVVWIEFVEPGSGNQHQQELKAYIPMGTIIKAKARFSV